MIGEKFKEEADAAWKKYHNNSTVVDDNPSDPPLDSASAAFKTGIKAFLHDFGLEKSMNPLTLLKIYGNFNE